MIVLPRITRTMNANDGAGESKTGRHSRIPALALAALIAALPGCAAFPLGDGSMKRHRPLEPGPEPIRAVEHEAKREQAMLAAVEEFLRATDDFQIAEQGPAAPIDRGPAEPPLQQSQGSAVPQAGIAERAGPLEEEHAAVANARVALSADAPRRPNQTLPVIRSVSIPPLHHKADPAPAEDEEGTTNQALEVQKPTEEMTEVRFVHYLESSTSEDDAFDFDAEWRLRLVHAALDHFTEATKISPKMSPDAANMLDSLVRVTDATRLVARDPLTVGDEALHRVDELRRILADRADPIVKVIELCRKVVTFGVFEPMDAEEFIAGRTIRTIVYTEIDNLSAEETPDGQQRTSLATRAEVLTADGASVWQHEEPEIMDLCRRRRTDFFIAQRITLPPTLAAGEYVLKLLVEDKLSGKASESSRHFTIQSPISIASSG